MMESFVSGSVVNLVLFVLQFAGLLQVYLASDFLRRPIRQFCLLPGADHYRTRVEPFHLQNDEEIGTSINILWVPLTADHGQDNRYNHVVPLLPWKCGAAPHKFCIFNSVMNNKFSNLRSDMAQCDLCHEWYHTCCLGLSLHNINRLERFSCGCDVLPADADQITTRNA
jgi:hypothetical protein